MVAPPYCRTLDGRLYRIVRSSEMIAPDRVRYTLRAQALKPDSGCADLELAHEVDMALIRDKIANHHIIPTPEATFEALWQQLQVVLDSRQSH
jgi:hypothetical protein